MKLKKIYVHQPKILLLQKKSEYKYLSPHIFSFKKNYYMAYCNRKNRKKFYGEINFAKSKNLASWKKTDKIFIKPRNLKKFKSYLSPAHINIKKKNYLFLEGQRDKCSEILCYEFSNNLKFKKKNFFIKFFSNKKLLQSPFIFKNGSDIFLYYSQNRNKIKCLLLDENLKFKKSFNCIDSTKLNEKFSIYSPSIIKHKSKFYMFYAAWKNEIVGNVNVAVSNNLINWKKIKQNIFVMKKSIKIISEPFLYTHNNRIYLFYEFKENDVWNISFKLFSKKEFEYLIN